MQKSVRQLILEDMKQMFLDIVVNDPMHVPPIVSDFDFAFSVVELGPLSDADAKKKNAVGIVAGRERKTFQFPYEMCFMPTAIEFRVTVNRGDVDPQLMAELALTPIQNLLRGNRTVNGRALDGKEIGNEIDLTTYGDKTVAGVVFWEVQYRHAHGDVTDPNPTV